MVEAIVKDSNRVLPAAAWVTGQYGLEGHVHRRPGASSARAASRRSSSSNLNDKEQSDMKASGDHVLEVIQAYQNLPKDDA